MGSSSRPTKEAAITTRLEKLTDRHLEPLPPLEGARHIGVALYLTAITLGLGTIISVLGFQSQRIREEGSEAAQI